MEESVSTCIISESLSTNKFVFDLNEQRCYLSLPIHLRAVMDDCRPRTPTLDVDDVNQHELIVRAGHYFPCDSITCMCAGAPFIDMN